MSGLTIEDLEAARRDPVVFAERLIGQPLWEHQVEVARSEAKYCVICAGRRAGKSHVFGVLALHRAFSSAGARVLIVSAGEAAAKNMFDAIAAMARGSVHLAPSVVDDLTQSMTLSNGSTIRCVPSSMRQVRSQEADLLIVDEAGTVPQEIWDAVEPVTIARPGARILVCGSPWGGPGWWFHDLWRRGRDSPTPMLRSWHWPSTVSPLVDQEQLEELRVSRPAYVFRREILAEWAEASGAYFTEEELSAAVVDYGLIEPRDALEGHGQWLDGPGWVRELPAVGGIDWGVSNDANALVLLSPLEDFGLNDTKIGEGRRPVFVSWMEARHRMPYTDFIDRVLEVCQAFDVQMLASERNGVGAYPTDDLRKRMHELGAMGGLYGTTHVRPVWTDARRKMSGFGQLKGMLQRGQLVLPNEPELLTQLRALEFSQTEAGSLKIAVPDRLGHDDLAMALLQAVSSLRQDARWAPDWRDGDGAWRDYRASVVAAERRLAAGEFEVRTAGNGIRVPLPVRSSADVSFSRTPRGDENGEGW